MPGTSYCKRRTSRFQDSLRRHWLFSRPNLRVMSTIGIATPETGRTMCHFDLAGYEQMDGTSPQTAAMC